MSTLTSDAFVPQIPLNVRRYRAAKLATANRADVESSGNWINGDRGCSAAEMQSGDYWSPSLPLRGVFLHVSFIYSHMKYGVPTEQFVNDFSDIEYEYTWFNYIQFAIDFAESLDVPWDAVDGIITMNESTNESDTDDGTDLAMSALGWLC